MEWIVMNWELISSCAVLLIFIVNAATRHFAAHTGLVKVLLIITEYLSLFASRDVPAIFKAPLTSKPPGPGPVNKLPPLSILLVLLVLPSCASWQSGVKLGLDEAGVAAREAQPLIASHYAHRCELVASKCAGLPCDALAECQAERRTVNDILKGVHVARVAGYSALLLEQESEAKGYARRAVEAVAALWAALKKAGVL